MSKMSKKRKENEQGNLENAGKKNKTIGEMFASQMQRSARTVEAVNRSICPVLKDIRVQEGTGKVSAVEVELGCNSQEEPEVLELDTPCHTQPSPFPDVWSLEKYQEKKEKYQWLFCKGGKIGCTSCRDAHSLGPLKEPGVSLSSTWCRGLVDGGDNPDKVKQLSSLRNKIKKHKESRAHAIAVEIEEKKKSKPVENSLKAQECKSEVETEIVFQTAYYLAKKNRPFSDHPDLLELQQKNGSKVGSILHSRFSATNIIDHVSTEMKKKMVEDIVSSNTKISVLIDESTTLSLKSVMIVSLKAAVNGGKSIFVFLELVELDFQTAEHITEKLIACLKGAGFTEDFLQKNWVSFVSDGASVMMGKNSGVAKRLCDVYPLIFPWHCMNHRLELAVGDAVKAVTAINHFKSFLDCIYSLYSQSTKNQRELSNACKTLEVQLLRIGRVLDVRWVASSFRTIHAVWSSFSALHSHFIAAGNDLTRDAVVRKKFNGLAKRLASPEFVSDLGLLYDVLQELSSLSLDLQAKSTTLSRADYIVNRTIRVLESFKERPGEHMQQALQAKNDFEFHKVKLVQNSKLKTINSKQFIQSIADNLRQRLCEPTESNAEVLSSITILDPTTWPKDPDIRHGEQEVRRLSQRFDLNAQEAVYAMREFVEDPLQIPPGLQQLNNLVQTLPCSTAECERGFSLMNIISTDLRSTLLVKNVSNLMFVNINGPPFADWDASPYVQSWIKYHRRATDQQSRKTKKKDYSTDDRSKLWALF